MLGSHLYVGKNIEIIAGVINASIIAAIISSGKIL